MKTGKAFVIPVKNITDSCEEVCRIHETIPFDEEHLEKMSDKFSAISNPTRLKIILLAMEYGEITTCEVENALDLNQSKVSYHLQNLLHAGILERRTYGPWSFYSLKDKSEILKMFRLVGEDELDVKI